MILASRRLLAALLAFLFILPTFCLTAQAADPYMSTAFSFSKNPVAANESFRLNGWVRPGDGTLNRITVNYYEIGNNTNSGDLYTASLAGLTSFNLADIGNVKISKPGTYRVRVWVSNSNMQNGIEAARLDITVTGASNPTPTPKPTPTPTTAPPQKHIPPTIIVDRNPQVTTNDVVLSGNISSFGSSGGLLQRGFMLGTSASNMSMYAESDSIGQTGAYSRRIGNLSANTKYYYTAYVKYMDTTTWREEYAYGDTYSFTTAAAPVQKTEVQTGDAKNITVDGATLSGYLVNSSGESTQCGFYISNAYGLIDTVIVGTYNSNGAQFSGKASSLKGDTAYTFQAFATNVYGTVIGQSVAFRTAADTASDLQKIEQDMLTTNIIFAAEDNQYAVTKEITLPTRGVSNDSVIAWISSSQPSVLSTSGKVDRPMGGDTEVILTARYAFGSATKDKTVRLTVKGKTEIAPHVDGGSSVYTIKEGENLTLDGIVRAESRLTAVTANIYFTGVEKSVAANTTSYNLSDMTLNTAALKPGTYLIRIWAKSIGFPTAENAIKTIELTVSVANAGLTVTPAVLSFDNTAKSQSMTLTATGAWTATKNGNWITINESSGTQSGVIIVSVAANPGNAARTGSVTIKSGNLTKTVTVTQAGTAVLPKITNLTCDKKSIKAGESITITLKTDKLVDAAYAVFDGVTEVALTSKDKINWSTTRAITSLGTRVITGRAILGQAEVIYETETKLLVNQNVSGELVISSPEKDKPVSGTNLAVRFTNATNLPNDKSKYITTIQVFNLADNYKVVADITKDGIVADYLINFLPGGDYSMGISVRDKATNACIMEGSTTFEVKLSMNNLKLPSSMVQGEFPSIDGTLSSYANITNVSIKVFNASGALEKIDVSAQPNSTSYQLSALDKKVLFNTLSPGKKKILIRAEDAAGNLFEVNPELKVAEKPNEPIASVNSSQAFIDVEPNKWYTKPIENAFLIGLISGTGNNKFDPNGLITAQALYAICYRAVNQPVDWDKIYSTAIKDGLLFTQDAIASRFAKPIRRHEMAMILSRFVDKYSLYNEPEYGPQIYFSDISVSEHSAEIYTVVRNGYMVGIGGNKFNPHGDTTRAQAAVVANRLNKAYSCSFIGQIKDEKIKAQILAGTTVVHQKIILDNKVYIPVFAIKASLEWADFIYFDAVSGERVTDEMTLSVLYKYMAITLTNYGQIATLMQDVWKQSEKVANRYFAGNALLFTSAKLFDAAAILKFRKTDETAIYGGLEDDLITLAKGAYIKGYTNLLIVEMKGAEAILRRAMKDVNEFRSIQASSVSTHTINKMAAEIDKAVTLFTAAMNKYDFYITAELPTESENENGFLRFAENVFIKKGGYMLNKLLTYNSLTSQAWEYVQTGMLVYEQLANQEYIDAAHTVVKFNLEQLSEYSKSVNIVVDAGNLIRPQEIIRIENDQQNGVYNIYNKNKNPNYWGQVLSDK